MGAHKFVSILILSMSVLILGLLPACSPMPTPAPTVVPTLTYTIVPTNTATTTNTPVPTATATRITTRTPTPTPFPQLLGRIFPNQFHGQTIWSDAGGNADRNYADQGWHCPPDGGSTNCLGHLIHYDVALPDGFTSSDFILSPVDGKVKQIYDTGGGYSIVIVPNSWFVGLDALMVNYERINGLAKGIFTFDYNFSDIKSVALHLAHILPLVKEGEFVTKGQAIANVEFNVPWNPKKVAYVIYVHMIDGSYWQFGPCDVANEDEFCGKCTSGSPYCPYKIINP